MDGVMFLRLLLAFLLLIVATTYSLVSPPSTNNQNDIAFVSDELVLDFSKEKAGEWLVLVETQSDRILFFSFPQWNTISKQSKDSLMIYDGPVPDPSRILYPSAEHSSVIEDDNNLKSRFYSTENIVLIRYHRPLDAQYSIASMEKLQLKIQKAVDCSVSLGGSSSCGRVVDDVSCYCGTFILRNWTDTKQFCLDNKMTFLRIDGYDEDLAVYRAWGGQQDLWIGATDSRQDGNWTWDNGGRPIYPGYANWYPGAPDNLNDQDCMLYWIATGFAWDDQQCERLKGGICEAQP